MGPVCWHSPPTRAAQGHAALRPLPPTLRSGPLTLVMSKRSPGPPWVWPGLRHIGLPTHQEWPGARRHPSQAPATLGASVGPPGMARVAPHWGEPPPGSAMAPWSESQDLGLAASGASRVAFSRHNPGVGWGGQQEGRGLPAPSAPRVALVPRCHVDSSCTPSGPAGPGRAAPPSPSVQAGMSLPNTEEELPLEWRAGDFHVCLSTGAAPLLALRPS